MACAINKGTWKHSKTGQTITGTYQWDRSYRFWVICLDVICPYFGNAINGSSYNEDQADFGDWKLVKETKDR